MILEILSELWQNKKVRYAFFATLLIILLAFVFSLLNRKSYTQHYVTKTNLKQSENFSYLDGSKILAYNGLAFYQIDLSQDNKISTLSDGQKLPTPEKVFWASDKGALMTFKSSFTYTLVEDELAKLGKKLDSVSRNYVWYYDFASGKLSLVSEDPLRAKLAAFSKKENGFYLTVEQSKGDFTKMPVLFYDLNKTVTVTDSIGYGEALNMFICPSDVGGNVCVTSRNEESVGKQIVQRIDRNGQKKTVYETEGQIFESSNPNYLLASKVEAKEREEDPVEGDVFQGNATLVNLATNEETDLDFQTTGSSLIGNIPDDGSFYVIDTTLASTKLNKKDGSATYTSGTINDKSVKFGSNTLLSADSTTWEGGVINLFSYGDSGRTLVADFDGSSVVVSPDQGINPIPIVGTEDVKKLVGNCVKTAGLSDFQYFEDSSTFRLLLVESPTWHQQLNGFTDCVNSPSSKAMYGFNYQISLRDSSNGRLISD